VTTISLLSAAKKPLAINFTYSLQRIGRNALFEITLFPKNCIENNTLLKITIAQEQAQMLNPLYELVSKIAQISLKGFCPFDDILFNVKSLSTLNDIQYSTSPYVNMVILLFSSANLGIISASDILYLSKFLNISFPPNLLCTFSSQLKKSAVDDFFEYFTVARENDEPQFPFESHFNYYAYSIFVWNNRTQDLIVLLLMAFA